MSATVLKITEATSAPVVTLRQRIADALTKPTSSGEVRACIAHTQGDLGRVERERQRAEAKARDPLSTEEEAADGKREAEALRFDLERLTASEARLKARLEAVTDDEDQAERCAAYDAVKEERDAVVLKLKTVYPRAVAEISGALKELAAVEAKILAVNAQRPKGADHMAGAEMTAVGRPINGNDGVWPMTGSVALPARFGSEGLSRGGPWQP